MLSNRMTFQRSVVRNITEDRVGNCDLRCLHAFLCFIYLFISLTNFFLPFPVQTSQRTDMMLCKSALKGTTWQAPRKKNQYREQWTSDSPTKRHFPPLKMPKIYLVPAQSCMCQGNDFEPKCIYNLFYPHFKRTSPRRTTSVLPKSFRTVSSCKMKRLCKCKHMSVLSCEVIAIAWGEFPCWAI